MRLDPELMRQASLAFSLVLQLIIITLLGFWAGGWLDKELHVQTIFQVSFTFIGFIVGIYNLIQRLRK